MSVTLQEALLDSWDRQCRIVNAVAGLVDGSNQGAKPLEDGWTLGEQLEHIEQVRQFWLSQFVPGKPTPGWEEPGANQDLGDLRRKLEASGREIREATSKALDAGIQKTGAYDNPVLFLQHMVWHEGWHVGLLFLGLRLAGQEPTDEWSEAHVWGEWRTE